MKVLDISAEGEKKRRLMIQGEFHIESEKSKKEIEREIRINLKDNSPVRDLTICVFT